MEHLKPLVVKVIEKTIESEGYNHTRVGEWESKIIEESMKQLVEFSSSYKYICKILFFILFFYVL